MTNELSKQHTIHSANEVLTKKGILYLVILEIDKENDFIVVEDQNYGKYRACYKALCPSSKFPLHVLRKKKNLLDQKKAKFIGKVFNGITVLDVFYAQDRGYKARGVYVEYTGVCGHTLSESFAVFSKHRKSFKCQECRLVEGATHGERQKIDGVLVKRSPTYNYWVTHKEDLPGEFKFSYQNFRDRVGEKPFRKARLIEVAGKWHWQDLNISDDSEINMISTAVRRAFRFSKVYRSVIANARVETPDGPRYRCAFCGGFFKKSQVEVDHIEPISGLDGKSLTRENVIDRIWTDRIQVLDKKCHQAKSNSENTIRADGRKAETRERRLKEIQELLSKLELSTNKAEIKKALKRFTPKKLAEQDYPEELVARIKKLKSA